MKEDFVMRGKTDSGKTETLNFGGHKDGYGFILTEFSVFGSNALTDVEIVATLTAGKTAHDVTDVNYNDEGLIAVSMFATSDNRDRAGSTDTQIVNDTFVITQDLILMVQDQVGNPVNWQCRFTPVKLDTAKQALTNYRQFMIFDE
jgi:hypothetical protein